MATKLWTQTLIICDGSHGCPRGGVNCNYLLGTQPDGSYFENHIPSDIDPAAVASSASPLADKRTPKTVTLDTNVDPTPVEAAALSDGKSVADFLQAKADEQAKDDAITRAVADAVASGDVVSVASVDVVK